MRRMIVGFVCLVFGVASVGAMHNGRVYVDKNGNGVYDPGERPLGNVVVSDGLHVTTTSAEGLFKLPGHEKERFIFITTPAGYKTNNRHYLAINRGQPSYNFGVLPYERGARKSGGHRFIHVSDTEIFNTTDHEDWVSNLRNYVCNEEVAFIMHTGDICYEKGLNEHINLMNTSNMGCPVFYGIGNHDLVKGEYGEALFEKIYGPVFYSFDMGDTHYVVTPMLSGDYQPSYTKEDVYRWLINDLRHVPHGKPVIVFSHDLLSHDENFVYGISDTEAVDLNKHNLKAWIYGHWHINHMKKQGKVLTICTNSLDKGGIDHSATAFRVVDVSSKGDVSSRLRYAYIDKHIEIASPGSDGYPILASGAMPITVNAYHASSPTKEVAYSCFVDGKRVINERKLTRKTDWSWSDAAFLSHLPEGKEVMIRATATFNNGEKASKEMRFPHKKRKQITMLTDSWSNLLGNAQHVGISKSELKLPLKMAWTSNIGVNIFMTSPVVEKGVVYMASTDENLEGGACIYALSGQTGQVLWKYYVDNSIKNSIAVENDVVYAQTVQGNLYAINAKDGTLKWGIQLHVKGLPAIIDGLVLNDGVIYAGSGSGLYAFEATKGKRIWQNTGWQQGEGTTSTLSYGDGMLIASAQWKGSFGHDAQTGEVKWQLNKDGISDRGSSAAIHNHLLYLISGKSLFIIDAQSGTVVVRKEYPFNLNATSTPLVTEKGIYFGSVDNGLVAVDRETLEVKWLYETGDALVYTAPYTRKPSATVETSPVMSGNTVYFGASDGALYGVNAETGELEWRHATGAPVLGSVAVSGNTLLAVDLGGNVYAFTGSE